MTNAPTSRTDRDATFPIKYGVAIRPSAETGRFWQKAAVRRRQIRDILDARASLQLIIDATILTDKSCVGYRL